MGRNYSAGLNPADLVWYLLTDAGLGDLDSTPSSANADIDYTQWDDWKSRMSSIGIALQGNFTGQTIGEILKKVMKHSHSTIFAEGLAKIVCRYWLEEIDSAGSGDFDEDNIFSEPNLKVGLDDVINRVTVFYGYNPGSKTWAGHRDKDVNSDLEDTTSQSYYGLRESTYEDTAIWVPSSSAADAFGEKIIGWWKNPKQEIEFDAGLAGYPHQLSDALNIKWPLLDIYFNKNEGFVLQEITMDVMEGKCSWKGRQANFQDYFILDDATFGLLDQSNNPLF